MIAIFVSVPVIIFREQMGFLFTSSPKVAAEVASAIVPLIIYQFSDGLQCTFSNAMRGLAYVKPVMLVAFLSYFVVSLPLAYLFGISLYGGLVGVWFSFPFGLTLAGALYYHFYQRQSNKVNILLSRQPQSFHWQRFMSTQPLDLKRMSSWRSRSRCSGKTEERRPSLLTTRWQGRCNSCGTRLSQKPTWRA